MLNGMLDGADYSWGWSQSSLYTHYSHLHGKEEDHWEQPPESSERTAADLFIATGTFYRFTLASKICIH